VKEPRTSSCGSLSIDFWVTIARGTHPFPSRTRQLSLSAPMVLHAQVCGRVGSRPVYITLEASQPGGFFCSDDHIWTSKSICRPSSRRGIFEARLVSFRETGRVY